MKNYLDAMKKILPVHSDNSVVSASLLILFHNRIRKIGICCYGFGHRVVCRNELRGVPFAVLNVDIFLSQN